jgi:ribosomal protein L40E
MNILLPMQESRASNIEVPVSEDMICGRCIGKLPSEAAHDCR